MMPAITHSLIKQGILKAEHIAAGAGTIALIVYKNRKKALRKVVSQIEIEREFLDQAIENWRRNRKYLAIVLYAVAMEQFINQMYAILLRHEGLEDREVADTIKQLNVEAKLSWFLKLVAKAEFPTALGKRIRAVFELRNAIIHFKAAPFRMDQDTDSQSKIDAGLARLRRLSISRDFRLLEETMWKIAKAKDPDIESACKAAELYCSRWK